MYLLEELLVDFECCNTDQQRQPMKSVHLLQTEILG